MRGMTLGVVAVVLASSFGCASYSENAPSPSSNQAKEDGYGGLGSRGAGYGGGGAMEPEAAMAAEEMADDGLMDEQDAPAAAPMKLARSRDKAEERRAPSAKDRSEPEEAEEPATRAWFPESLLWQPLVETDGDGMATVPVRVPDQLTTWRVLALAHDRRGQQAGAEYRFQGTLPVYVEPVMPGWLYAGDTLRLPVQAVNTTERALEGSLELLATGAVSGNATASIALGPGGSAVRMMPLAVTGAGQATVKTTLRAGKASDAAERSVRITPSGKPVEASRGGTLTGERTLTLKPPRGADPSTETLEVLVFPGPLSVLQAELERLSGGPADGAYAFAVATNLEALAEAAGVEVAPGVLRRLRILAWQRVVRAARAPSAGEAADLLLGLHGVTGHELAEQRRAILEQKVADGQRADGSWSRVATSTVQRVVVETALAARVLPEEARGPRLRAAGALERFLPQVDDPYTAAVVLSSGLVEGETAEALRTQVKDALVDVDGQMTLPVPPGVVNAWGVRPSMAEMRAFGALALEGEAQGDLVSALMQGWSSSYGFGAGRADAVALDAIILALPTSSTPVSVSLVLDGDVVATAPLDPSQPKVPAVLMVSPSGRASVTLRAEPEVPGLAFVATRRSWVPWSASDRLPGVDVEVELGRPAVGREGVAILRVAAPKGVSVRLEQGLPAGASVNASVYAGDKRITAHDVRPDRIALTTRAFGAGEIMEIPVPVTPAFAGTFGTSPLSVSAEGRTVLVRPALWSVSEGG